MPPCTGPNYQQSTSRDANGSREGSFIGGEGGIRTLGTLIRGTHDFQSCTFNRSVTSPGCNTCRAFAPFRLENRELVQGVREACAAPCLLSKPPSLQNVSTQLFRLFWLGLPIEITTYHTNLSLAKRNLGFIRGARSRLVHHVFSAWQLATFWNVSHSPERLVTPVHFRRAGRDFELTPFPRGRRHLRT